jgi:hypothetical protein
MNALGTNNGTAETWEWFDSLDGESLACSPGDIAEGYDAVCFYIVDVMGSAQVILGCWLFYIAHLQRRLVKGKVSTMDIAASSGKAATWAKRRLASRQNVRVAVVVGVVLTSAGLGWLLSGHGTKSGDGAVGLLGDAFGKLSEVPKCTHRRVE